MDDKPLVEGACSGSRDPFLVSMPAVISLKRLKRESPNFCMQVKYIKC